MTRLVVSRAEFDGAVLLAVAAGMDPDRARAAAELLYRLEPAADRGAAGPSPTAATPRVVVGDTPKERTEAKP